MIRQLRARCWEGTRTTQIMNLLNLAPDIQEALLFLPGAAKGRDSGSEREMRAVCDIPEWRGRENGPAEWTWNERKGAAMRYRVCPPTEIECDSPLGGLPPEGGLTLGMIYSSLSA